MTAVESRAWTPLDLAALADWLDAHASMDAATA